MVKPVQVYDKIKASPNNVRFEEICAFAESLGFVRKIKRGRKKSGTSHNYKYLHPKLKEVLNFQNNKGQAVPYQVRQLLRIIRDNNLIRGQ
jgi:hypothetical protein